MNINNTIPSDEIEWQHAFDELMELGTNKFNTKDNFVSWMFLYPSKFDVPLYVYIMRSVDTINEVKTLIKDIKKD